MRQLLPEVLDAVDLPSTYPAQRPASGRPRVVATMVTSLDGSATVGGVSGPLGGEPDRAVFHHLRSTADVVLVGAGTARAERYRAIGGPRPVPVAIVTRSLDLDLDSPLFRDPPATTIVVTCSAADATRREALADVADIVVAGKEEVLMGEAIDALAARGHRRVLCEGGPGLLARVVDEGLLDELCLTIAPTLAGGDGPRILRATWEHPRPLRLASLLEEDGVLLARYLAD